MPYAKPNNQQPIQFEDAQHPIWSEWVGMPEFVQEKQDGYAKIIVRVRNQEDLDALSKALNQPLTPKTKSAWFPALTRGIHSNKRYVNES
jgi:hypothetical protein